MTVSSWIDCLDSAVEHWIYSLAGHHFGVRDDDVRYSYSSDCTAYSPLGPSFHSCSSTGHAFIRARQLVVLKYVVPGWTFMPKQMTVSSWIDCLDSAVEHWIYSLAGHHFGERGDDVRYSYSSDCTAYSPLGPSFHSSCELLAHHSNVHCCTLAAPGLSRYWYDTWYHISTGTVRSQECLARMVNKFMRDRQKFRSTITARCFVSSREEDG